PKRLRRIRRHGNCFPTPSLRPCSSPPPQRRMAQSRGASMISLASGGTYDGAFLCRRWRKCVSLRSCRSILSWQTKASACCCIPGCGEVGAKESDGKEGHQSSEKG